MVPETVEDLDGITERDCVGLTVDERDSVVDDEVERVPATELLVVPEVVILID
jgi:hypothetical protein